MKQTLLKLYNKLMYLNPVFFGKIFKIIKHSLDEVELYNSIKSNKKYKNIHKGERCFVLGNGPSIKGQDLSLLKDEYVFTVNQITRNKDFDKIKPNYHFWADPIFFDIDLENNKNTELFDVMKSVKTQDNSPVVFFASSAYKMVKKTKLDSILNIEYFKPNKKFEKYTNKKIRFDRDTASFNTVVQYAITMAIYMGFSKIYLLGSEMTGILTSIEQRLQNFKKAEYAYDISEKENNRMKERIEKIPFDVELNGFYKIFRGYSFIADYCQKRDILLLNCTPGGLVDSLKRKNYEEIFLDDKKNG